MSILVLFGFGDWFTFEFWRPVGKCDSKESDVDEYTNKDFGYSYLIGIALGFLRVYSRQL